jgi:hypothetical protein
MLRKSDHSRITFPHCFFILFSRGRKTVSAGRIPCGRGSASSGKHADTFLSRAREQAVWMMPLIGIAVSMMSFVVIGSEAPASVEMQLEAAIHREIVIGDLKGAMEQYKLILGQPQKSRTVAARAVFQTAQCLEKLGRRAEARDTYARVLKQYADEPEIAAQARARLSEWDNSIPGPLNLKFEDGLPGKLPAAWFVPALPKDADHWAQVRRSGCMNNGSCAVVLVPDNAPVRVGNLMQSFSATAYRGKTLRLTAWLRLEATDPDDRAQMWLSVDRLDDGKGFFDNMNDRPVRSAEWTKCEIRAKVDNDATFVKFGVMSIGRGRVWVDDVSFEVLSKPALKNAGSRP